MLGDTFNCFTFGATFCLLPHSLGRTRTGSDTHHIIITMINEILAPDKKLMFRNKYILEKGTETLDIISTVDIYSAQPSVYWTSVRQSLRNLNKADTHMKIFRMEKRIIRIMMSYKNKVSCRNLFRRLKILPFVSQYILLLMFFVVNNKILFTLNSENHTKGTRQSNNFYQPITNLTVYQKGVHYMALRF